MKNIDSYDYGDAGMISILLDMVPDEVTREITTQHKTTGTGAETLKKIMIEVEKIIEREKDRKKSRGDRKPEPTKKKMVAFAGPTEIEDLCQVCGGPGCQPRVWRLLDGSQEGQRRGGRRGRV